MPSASTDPWRVTEVAPVGCTSSVDACGWPGVKGTWPPRAVPEAFWATISAQYCVPAVRPLRFTVTPWKLLSCCGSDTGDVLVGVPLVPLLVHQGEVAGAYSA